MTGTGDISKIDSERYGEGDESRSAKMNRDNTQPAAKRTYPGRRYLLLGGLAVVAGPVIYSVQMLNHSLIAAWYFPVLATLGAMLIVWSFVKARTIVRG